ncbi:MAG: hypothetical protein Kow0062_02060 [Acidobacteriota bacterium]
MRRAVLPVVLLPRTHPQAGENGCSTIDTNDIRVFVGGRKARVTAFEREERAPVLAVVYDYAIGSHWQNSRDAATVARLVQGLSEDWHVMLAASSSEFELKLAPTRDKHSIADCWPRDHLCQWERGLRPLYLADRLLRAQDRPKVIVLVTTDVNLDQRFDPAIAVQAIEEDPDTVVVGVYPRLPGDEEHLVRNSIIPERRHAMMRSLESIARRSGGAFFTGMDPLADAAPTIAAIAGGRAEVTIAVEERPGDPPWAERLRRVKIRMAKEAGCFARLMRKAADVPDSATRRVRDGGRIEDAGPALARLGLADVRQAPATVFEVRALSPLIPGSRDWRPAWIVEGLRQVLAQAPAIVRSSAPITPWKLYERSGAYDQVRWGRPMAAVRPVAVAAPPVEMVRRSLHTAHDVVRWLLEQPFDARRGADSWPAVGSPLVVEGVTAIEYQEVFGTLLARGFEDWRRAASALREWRIAEEIERLADGRPVDAETRRILREAVLDKARRRGWWEDWSFLGGILGDVRLEQIGRTLDLELAGRLLDTRAHGDDVAPVADEAESLWDRLTAFFPPGAEVHVLVPLVPAWSDEQQRFGFWRVLLPADHLKCRPGHLPGDFLPEAPLATRAVRAAIARGLIAGDGWRATGLAYEGPRIRRLVARITLENDRGASRVLEATFRRKALDRKGLFEITLQSLEVAGAADEED